MALNFKGSPNPTIGVEIELQILNPETLDLNPQAELLLEKCQIEGLHRVKAEIHQSMLEIDTEISDNVKQCREFLTSRIQGLNKVAQKLGLKVAVAGTHPFQRWSDRLISNTERYKNLHEKYQWLVRRMNVYGLHVHIGVKSGEHALAISNALIRFLPHLLALSANSPFWQGTDTGMQSTRINIMESFPLAGVPIPFSKWSDFEYYCDTMTRGGVITSLKDLYWLIRPNLNFGTIEFRVCDAMANLDEVMALVALIQCLVVYVENSLDSDVWKWTKEQQWIAPENQWRAARDGLDAFIITPNGENQNISQAIFQLVKELASTAKHLDCSEELQYITKIVAEGNGATRQRKIFNETQSLKDVVTNSIEEFESNTAMV